VPVPGPWLVQVQVRASSGLGHPGSDIEDPGAHGRDPAWVGFPPAAMTIAPISGPGSHPFPSQSESPC
jgi:hypothetical protein